MSSEKKIFKTTIFGTSKVEEKTGNINKCIINMVGIC